jgi:aquaporin Z
LFVGGWAVAQLWLFWVAPLMGAFIGGFAYKWLGGAVEVAETVPRPAAPAE